jgi:hypothetical protein
MPIMVQQHHICPYQIFRVWFGALNQIEISSVVEFFEELYNSYIVSNMTCCLNDNSLEVCAFQV